MFAVIARNWRNALLGLAAVALSAPAWPQALEPAGAAGLDALGRARRLPSGAAEGWYRQAGLDVSLEDGNGSVTTVQIVGAGDSFDLGHAALASAMIAREKGMPVKAVAVFARQSDIGLLVPADAGISGPRS